MGWALLEQNSGGITNAKRRGDALLEQRGFIDNLWLDTAHIDFAQGVTNQGFHIKMKGWTVNDFVLLRVCVFNGVDLYFITSCMLADRVA